jgi:hypothetical protein
MKKAILSVLLILSAAAAHSQSMGRVLYGNGVPDSSTPDCTQTMAYINSLNGDLYTSVGKPCAWVLKGNPTTPTAQAAQVSSTFNNWIQTTPTVSCATGTPTTVTSVLNTEIVGKTASFNFTITETAIGTCSGSLLLSLPFTPAQAGTIVCAEIGNAGVSGYGSLSASDSHVYIASSTGGNWNTNGDIIVCSGIAQTQ